MTLDLSLFTPEVLATLELKNGKIRPTSDTRVLLNSNDNVISCTNCPFYRRIDRCIVYDHQELLAKHFPELLI